MWVSFPSYCWTWAGIFCSLEILSANHGYFISLEYWWIKGSQLKMYLTINNRKPSLQRLKYMSFSFLLNKKSGRRSLVMFGGYRGGQCPGKSRPSPHRCSMSNSGQRAQIQSRKVGGRWGQLCPTLFIRKAKVFSDHAPKQLSAYASLARSAYPMAISTCVERRKSNKRILISLGQFSSNWYWVHCFSESNRCSVNRAEGGGFCVITYSVCIIQRSSSLIHLQV